SPDLRARRSQGRAGQRDGDEHAGGDHVWDELLGKLRQRHRGDADRHSSGRLDLRWLERWGLFGYGLLRRDRDRRGYRYGDVQSVVVVGYDAASDTWSPERRPPEH